MKKSLSLLLTFALVFGLFANMASAADDALTTEQKYQWLVDSKILKGTPDGEPYLDDKLTRAEFATIAVAVAGLTPATSGQTFTDVKEGQWYYGAIEAAAKAALVNGTGMGKFTPKSNVSVESIIKVAAIIAGLKPVEGAEVTGASSWAAGYVKAAIAAGLISESAVFQADATRGQAIDITYTVVQLLAGPKVVSAKAVDATNIEVVFSDDATAQKFVVAALAANKEETRKITYKGKDYDVKVTYSGLEVDSVSVTAANEMTVKLNRELAATEELKLVVKFGLLPQDVTAKVADDKKSVTLTAENSFIAGDYTVEVSGVEVPVKSFPVKVAAQMLESFTITTTNLTALATQPLTIQPVDQYGKSFDVASASFTVSATNVTDGTTVAVANNGNNKFTINTALTVDKNIVVTIIHNATGKSQSKTFKVATAAFVDGVSFEQPKPKADTTRITTNDVSNALVLPINLIDQYAQKVTGTTANLITPATKEITFVSSNTAIVNPASFAVNADGNITYQTGATAGNVTISAITKGGKSANVTFEVKAPAALASVNLQTPTGLTVVGEATKVGYVAVDSYGGAAKLAAKTDVVWFSTNPAVVDVATANVTVNAAGEITITPQGAGAATISVFLNGAKQSEITIDVKAAAVASKINKVADSAITLYNKASGAETYAAASIEVVDQYNRVIATTSLPGVVTVAVKDASTNTFTAAGATLTAADNQVGSKQIVLTYTDGAIVLTKEFTATVVEPTAVVGYAITDVANTKLFAGNFADATAAGGYAVNFVISNGLTTDSKKVALSTADKAALTVTTSDPLAVTVEGSKVFATGTSNGGSSAVAVWKNGVKVKEVNFTTSTAASVASELKFSDASVTIAKSTAASTAASVKLTGASGTRKDQYGATIALPAGSTWFSSDTSIATVNAATGEVTTTAKGGTVKITVVAPNGVNASINVVSE